MTFRHKAVNWNKEDDNFTQAFWEQNVKQFWLPEEISVSKDLKVWNQLGEAEKNLYKKVLGGLTLLDTKQANNGIPSMMSLTDNLQRKAVLSFMGTMEEIHAKSYSSIFTTLLSIPEIDEIFNWIETEPTLQRKAELVLAQYENTNDNEGLYLSMATSVFLESFLFYSGFYYPLYLAGQGKMTASGEIISLILRDESLHGKYIGLLAQEIFATFSDDKKIELKNKEQVDEILNDLQKSDFIVKDIKKGQKKRNPAPPFTTSTMGQEASRKLGFTLKKTMSVAQTLYEGVKIADRGTVGLITYMRTDSTRISEEARAAAKTHIVSTYGEEFYENRYYKTSKDAQDAHEGIRPTYSDIEPDDIKGDLSKDQYKLYKLIYNRFMASQMKPAVYDTIAVNIKANDYDFKANGQNLKFKGFMILYVEGTDEKEEQEEGMLPALDENQEVKLIKINPKQSFTEPPARYTEASLVKALEEKGIGRPSTYSPTITTILERRYIEKEQRQLVPTELGKIVNKLLTENFADIVNVEFTAKIENEFDEIAEGKEKWKKIIREFYGPFEQELEKAEKELEHVQLVDEVSDVQCEKCGRMMVYKYGRYGKFLACPGFPECRNVKPIIETIDVPCPKCGATVQVRKTKRKRNYYICENNPASCDYISWNKPKPGEKWNPEEAEEVKKETEKKTRTTKKSSTKRKTTAKKTKRKK